MSKIDAKIMNPLSFRSPGPVYNTSKNLELEHSYRFGTAQKLPDPKRLDINFENPDYTKTKEASMKTHFTSTHTTWHKT